MHIESDIHQRVQFFPEPFGYMVMNKMVDEFCSFCLRRPPTGQSLLYCAKCRFVRYCDRTCQKAHWTRDHKTECPKLQRSFPNLPLSEILYLARIVEKIRLIKEKGDMGNWQQYRKFEDLMGHQEEIKKDEVKMKYFEKHLEKLQTFMGDRMPPREEFFDIYCKTWINSHSIHTSAGTEVGMALDLGVSRYDHCCRPNCALVFDGFRAMIRPLVPGLDGSDWRKCFISYTDVGRSRYRRRNDLKTKWYFDCHCERCEDPDDDQMTCIKCSNPDCDEPQPISEDMEPKELTCPKCNSKISIETMKEGQQCMKDMPDKFWLKETEENINFLKEKLVIAEKYLHNSNIYYNRLLTAYMQLVKDPITNNPQMYKLVYQNYSRCFPIPDRHVGYQLLHLVQSLIEAGKRDEAVQYAYEAMQIFEVCFGLDHPYYLQTLALWTFLEKKIPKTNETLFGLMNFTENRPVDLAPYLEKAVKMDEPKNVLSLTAA